MEHKVDEIFDFFGTKVKCVDSKTDIVLIIGF